MKMVFVFHVHLVYEFLVLFGQKILYHTKDIDVAFFLHALFLCDFSMIDYNQKYHHKDDKQIVFDELCQCAVTKPRLLEAIRLNFIQYT